MIKVKAPGRINIIGEHTDYNNGFVLPAAIDKTTVFELQKTDKANTAHFVATNVQDSFTFDLSAFSPVAGGWPNYVMGVVHELQKLGATISGFDAKFHGDVPIGSGMSSSAALECSLAFGLNELFELGFDKWQLIRACQMAEHNFVGIKCGIMDQFASVMGKANQLMLLDCRSLEFEYFPLDLGNYELLLLNTNVAHALASSQFNARRAACEEGAAIFQKTQTVAVESLRDVSTSQFLAWKNVLPASIAKRCQHVISENERVLTATKALLNKDFKQLGQLMYQSHFSLQEDYEVSCPELDYLVELSLDKSYVLGSRMMGGGFGGCTLSIVEKKQVDSFIDFAAKQYKVKFDTNLTPYAVKIEDGAGFC